MNNIRSLFKQGVVAGIITISFVLLGITSLVGELIQDWFKLPSQAPGAWFLLLIFMAWYSAKSVKDAVIKQEKRN